METILGEMVRVENAQQVERGLRTIIRMSEQVREEVRPNPTQEEPR